MLVNSFIMFCLFFSTSIFVVGLFNKFLNNIFPDIVFVRSILFNIEFSLLSIPLNTSKSSYTFSFIMSLSCFNLIIVANNLSTFTKSTLSLFNIFETLGLFFFVFLEQLPNGHANIII